MRYAVAFAILSLAVGCRTGLPRDAEGPWADSCRSFRTASRVTGALSIAAGIGGFVYSIADSWPPAMSPRGGGGTPSAGAETVFFGIEIAGFVGTIVSIVLHTHASACRRRWSKTHGSPSYLTRGYREEYGRLEPDDFGGLVFVPTCRQPKKPPCGKVETP